MNLVKTFDTQDMPETIFNTLVEKTGVFVEDGVSYYVIGNYISEYELSKNKWLYSEQDIEDIKRFDNFLTSNGAEHGECVFIFHGTYHQFWLRIN